MVKNVIIYINSDFSNKDILTSGLINRLGINNVCVINVGLLTGSYKNLLEPLSYETIRLEFEKIKESIYDKIDIEYAIVQSVKNKTLLRMLREEFNSTVITVVFNNSCKYLSFKATELGVEANRKYVETEFYGYRKYHQGAELSLLMQEGDYYFNETNLITEQDVEEFYLYLLNKHSFSKKSSLMNCVSNMIQNADEESACILCDLDYNELARGHNHFTILDDEYNLIKHKTKKFIMQYLSEEELCLLELNRAFDINFNVHAEVDAVLNLKGKENCVIALVSKKPCINCLKILYQNGIKQIYYLLDFFDCYTDIAIEIIHDLKVVPFSGIKG